MSINYSLFGGLAILSTSYLSGYLFASLTAWLLAWFHQFIFVTALTTGESDFDFQRGQIFFYSPQLPYRSWDQTS
jgi:hypothetical protein